MAVGSGYVVVDFNPSGSADVDRIKTAAAALIDLLVEADDGGVEDPSRFNRWRALAIDHAETASMFGVKAVTAGRQ